MRPNVNLLLESKISVRSQNTLKAIRAVALYSYSVSSSPTHSARQETQKDRAWEYSLNAVVITWLG